MAAHIPGRPRLVEEGVPLTQNGSRPYPQQQQQQRLYCSSNNTNNTCSNNNTLYDRVDDTSFNSVASMELDDTYHYSDHYDSKPPAVATDSTGSSSSSLLRALRNSSPYAAEEVLQRKPHVPTMRSTRIVIGSNSIDDEQKQLSMTSNDCTTEESNCYYYNTPAAAHVAPCSNSHNINHYMNHHPNLHNNHHDLQTIHDPHHQQPYFNHTSPPPAATLHHRTHFEIGADDRVTEKMQGVQDLSVKPSLVVVDGANVAYAYAQTVQGLLPPPPVATTSSYLNKYTNYNTNKLVPDTNGIRVAYEYFTQANIRVLVVLPQSWFHTASKSSRYQEDADQMHVLDTLKRAGVLVAAPPTDDDDMYALTIAQRENALARRRGEHWRAHVLSNDLFRDAIVRDASLQRWLTVGDAADTNTASAADSNSTTSGPGRISYSFADLGNRDDHGDKQFDIVPNPRHPLIVAIESRIHQQQI
jgi:hypothetical protein